MANYKVVDADRLDADLLSVAQTIRTKGGTSEPLAWPDGYMSAVEAIQTGGAAPVIEPLEVTENGTYAAPDGVDGYSPVTVNVAGSGESGGSETEDLLVTREIQEYTNSRVKKIGDNAFNGCSILTSVNLPAVETIGERTFTMCKKLTFVNAPMATSAPASTFYFCENLISVNFPVVSAIGDRAFGLCKSLTSVNIPNATYIARSAFEDCASLISANFPVATNVASNAFTGCKNITSVSFPAVKIVGSYAFKGCSKLPSVSFPSASIISSAAFSSCAALGTAYFMGSSVCKLSNSTAFFSTLITSSTGSIFVPASLVASYQAATNWAYFSTQIFAGD